MGSLAVRDIMGVEVVVATSDDVVDRLAQALDEGPAAQVAFLNSHASNLAAQDPAFAKVLRDCMVLNDGIGVDLASRRLHAAPFPENLNGTDFVPKLLAELTVPRRIYLLGGEAGVAERAAEAITQTAPHHQVVGVRNGFFDVADERGVANAIAAVRAEVVLVALGNPKQELFVAEHAVAMGAPLVISVGALLDFLSGRVRRAPEWMQRWRLEWIFRLALEPGRMWRRYLVGNVRFLLRLARTPKTNLP